jgi:hypothetical protein
LLPFGDNAANRHTNGVVLLVFGPCTGKPNSPLAGPGGFVEFSTNLLLTESREVYRMYLLNLAVRISSTRESGYQNWKLRELGLSKSEG